MAQRSFQKWLILILLCLFLFLSVDPMVVGYKSDVDNWREERLNYDSYHVSEITDFNTKNADTFSIKPTISSTKPKTKIPVKMESTLSVNLGLLDSAWPMYCHDVRHTGRSPYSTEDNPGDEKWLYWIETQGIYGGITISDDGTIYFGALGFFALNPNETLKWKYEKSGAVRGCPAVDPVSTHTVENHIHRAMPKTGTSTPEQLADLTA